MSGTTTFADLLTTKEVVVVCGPGGVGKTTLAASIAVAAAVERRCRVLVLTVDPARRLADALGIAGIGNDATPVAETAFVAAGLSPKGTLDAAMLDVKASWDALVIRYSSDPSARRILASPLYRDLTARFPGSAEYVAMERLHELHTEGGYDLIVVDTPPGSRALDLFDAPDRLAEFFSSRLLRWLTVPARTRLGSAATRAFNRVAEGTIGSSFLEEIRSLFVLLGEMQSGFVDRAHQVSALLRAEETTFCVVATPESVPVREAKRLLDALSARSLHLGLLIANRVLPPGFLDPAAIAAADELVSSGGTAPVPGECTEGIGADSATRARVLLGAARSFGEFAQAAAREHELLSELADRTVPPVTVGDAMDEVVDLSGLAAIGRHLLSAPAPGRGGRRSSA